MEGDLGEIRDSSPRWTSAHRPVLIDMTSCRCAPAGGSVQIRSSRTPASVSSLRPVDVVGLGGVGEFVKGPEQQRHLGSVGPPQQRGPTACRPPRGRLIPPPDVQHSRHGSAAPVSRPGRSATGGESRTARAALPVPVGWPKVVAARRRPGSCPRRCRRRRPRSPLAGSVPDAGTGSFAVPAGDQEGALLEADPLSPHPALHITDIQIP